MTIRATINDTLTQAGLGGGCGAFAIGNFLSRWSIASGQFTRQHVSAQYILYSTEMPKLWAETVESHRQEVREAIQDATVALVSEQGLRAVTMSQIAEETGIGRATLYKYFPDVEAILRAWHERQIGQHLEELSKASAAAGDPFGRLAAVLRSYALIAHGSRSHRDTELAALLHGHHESHSHAELQLRRMVRELLKDAAVGRVVRTDVSSEELTEYCLHALNAANTLPSKASVQRLVDVTLSALQPEKTPNSTQTTKPPSTRSSLQSQGQ